MKIIDYIPVGQANAITARELKLRTGIKDARKIRRMIATERRNHIIINFQNNAGYFQPKLPEEGHLVKRYLAQEEHRGKSIFYALKPCRDYVKSVVESNGG